LAVIGNEAVVSFGGAVFTGSPAVSPGAVASGGAVHPLINNTKTNDPMIQTFFKLKPPVTDITFIFI
jgi:hypothetical protein